MALLSTTNHPPPTNHGVTFSPMYAKYLGLDFQKTYLSILDDLKVRHLRIPSYWSKIEKNQGKYDFSEVDFMVSEAEKRGAKIILVVGIKQPRWPECHIPDWAKELSVEKRQEKALEYIETTVKRYLDSTSIIAWQVENEPFVSWFGESCDALDANFLQKEVEMVKKLDPDRPIIITDSGEWSLWVTASKYADTLGISVYRKAHNSKLGLVTYPLPSWYYTLKSKLISKKTIISELQAEPWSEKGIAETAIEDQIKLFSPQDFKANQEYASKIGFGEVYFWGVEWWYYMAANGHPEYLRVAKTVFDPI